jgi:DNA-binding transcriptional LysR family regulator
VVRPVLEILRRSAPALRVELTVEDRIVDIVEVGADAGLRLEESLRDDMVAVRASAPFRFGPYASPRYLAERGAPRSVEQLAEHLGIGFRYPGSGRLYEWELQVGPRLVRVHPPHGVVVDAWGALRVAAVAGFGIAYFDAPSVADDVAHGRLVPVLPDHHPDGGAWSLYFPVRAQRQPKIRALVEAARAVATGAVRTPP